MGNQIIYGYMDWADNQTRTWWFKIVDLVVIGVLTAFQNSRWQFTGKHHVFWPSSLGSYLE